MKWFNRSLIAVIIGCLNILTYTLVCVTLIINLKYYVYSEYDYNEYSDVYESYKQRRDLHMQRELYGSIYVLMCLLMDVVSGLLIWGVLEKRPRLMAPWILASFVVLIYSAIVVMDDIFVKSSFQGVANSNLFFSALFLGFGLQLIALTIIYCLYKDMELENILIQYQIVTMVDNVQDGSMLKESLPNANFISNDCVEKEGKLRANISKRSPVNSNIETQTKRRKQIK